jgi:hypothetical protein
MISHSLLHQAASVATSVSALVWMSSSPYEESPRHRLRRRQKIIDLIVEKAAQTGKSVVVAVADPHGELIGRRLKQGC